jgi:hypothetical protein
VAGAAGAFLREIMATQPPLQQEEVEQSEPVKTRGRRAFGLGGDRASAAPRAPLGQVLRELNWRLLLLFGVGGGVFWTLLLTQQNTLTFLAGLLPVAGGIIVGRRVKQHVGWHAGLLSVITVIAALVTTALIASSGVVPPEFILQVVSLGLIALLPFPAFGVITANRSEQRNELLRAERARRGGRLEKPGRVKSIDELRSLSLPQLGGYVSDLFRKHDFTIQDFTFDKDNYLEFAMTHDDQPWVVRVTVDEKVKQGIVLQFVQRLRAEGLPRGVLITSMDFQDAAVRWAKDRPVALIDGPTLLSMHD